MSFYDSNRKELTVNYPGLFSALDAVPDAPDFEFLNAKVRGRTLRLGNRFIYSAFDPVTEAERQYSPVRRRFDLVILAGLGTGHLLEAVLTDPAVKAVRVFETDLALLKLVLENTAVHPFFSDPRVRLVWRPEDLDLLTEPLDLIGIKTVTLLSDASFSAGRQSLFLKSGALSSRLETRITELLTFSRMGMVWLDNFIANAPLRSRFRSAACLSDLVGKNKDRILLVGAGPSLIDLLPGIKKDKDRYLVVAIDTIAKHLERNGVAPDIVISVDSQPVSRLHFHGYAPAKAVFIFDVLSPPSAVSRFLDRAYFCRSANPASAFFGDDIPVCREGLSAANTAVELLHGLGAGTITLAGVDFSFPGDRVYTGGNYFSLYWSSLVFRTRPLDGFFLAQLLGRKSEKAETLEGGETNTVPVMRQYAGALDAFIADHPGLKVFSLSGKMISMKCVQVARSVPSGSAVRSGISDDAAGGRTGIEMPREWDRESLDKFFYPAIYGLVHRRSKRSCIPVAGARGATEDREWAFGVMERKSRLFRQ